MTEAGLRELPAAPDLLSTAAALLKDELLPALPASQRVQGLMVLRAIATAQRESAAGTEWPAAMLGRARALIDGPQPLQALSAAIRAGAFDIPGPRRDAVLTLLHDMARQRCAISNPRAMPAP